MGDDHQSIRQGGLHPLLIEDVMELVFESKILSITDLKNSRVVCSSWVKPATKHLIPKTIIKINDWSATHGITKFMKTFPVRKSLLSESLQLSSKSSRDLDLATFVKVFNRVLELHGHEIKGLILCNGFNKRTNEISQFLSHLFLILKKVPGLEHLGLLGWKFIRLGLKMNNDISKQYPVSSIALNNCKFTDSSAEVILSHFQTAFPALASVDLSNSKNCEVKQQTKIEPNVLKTCINCNNLTALKLPLLTKAVVDQLNNSGMKLKHFNVDLVNTKTTSPVILVSFLMKNNELESFGINKMDLMDGCLSYELPPMEKLRRLSIGGESIYCFKDRSTFFKTCHKLNELSLGTLPTDMIIENNIITALTLLNEQIWSDELFQKLVSVSRLYKGLRYLSIKMDESVKNVKDSLSNVFPNVLDLKIDRSSRC